MKNKIREAALTALHCRAAAIKAIKLQRKPTEFPMAFLLIWIAV